jgi:hypothetical protein
MSFLEFEFFRRKIMQFNMPTTANAALKPGFSALPTLLFWEPGRKLPCLTLGAKHS